MYFTENIDCCYLEILQQAHRLGAEIRAWCQSSLVKLADQAEHLDSIAESLDGA